MVIYSHAYTRVFTGGHVGIISAGTSDIPVAEEAALVAEEMGCRITCIYDVGVAGLHRLLGPLRDLLAEDVDVIIVAHLRRILRQRNKWRQQERERESEEMQSDTFHLEHLRVEV